MATNQKVTDLTVKTTVLDTDTYHVVDTVDFSQDPAGSSYKTTWASIKAKILTLYTAGTGILVSGAGVISSDPTAVQTLTNKTLTSPVINTPTITGATIGVTNLTVGSDANGDLYTRIAGVFSRLAAGSSNQILQIIGGVPTWQSVSIPTSYSNYVADTGAANAYAIAPSPALGSYSAGQYLVFKATNTNTTASTLTVNALSAQAIKKNGTAALTGGEIIAGQVYTVIYDGTNFQLLNPSTVTAANGVMTPMATTAAGNNDVTITTNFQPRIIRLHYFLQGWVNGSASFFGVKGIAVFNGTTLTAVTPIWGAQDGIGSALSGDQGTLAALASSMFTSDVTGSTLSAGTNAASSIKVTLTVPTITATSFTIRPATTVGAGNASTGRAIIYWEAFA